MHEHFAVALILATLRGISARQSEELQVEVAVGPVPRFLKMWTLFLPRKYGL